MFKELVKDQQYTLSFEIKRNNTTDINYIHLKKAVLSYKLAAMNRKIFLLFRLTNL